MRGKKQKSYKLYKKPAPQDTPWHLSPYRYQVGGLPRMAGQYGRPSLRKHWDKMRMKPITTSNPGRVQDTRATNRISGKMY